MPDPIFSRSGAVCLRSYPSLSWEDRWCWSRQARPGPLRLLSDLLSLRGGAKPRGAVHVLGVDS